MPSRQLQEITVRVSFCPKNSTKALSDSAPTLNGAPPGSL